MLPIIWQPYKYHRKCDLLLGFPKPSQKIIDMVNDFWTLYKGVSVNIVFSVSDFNIETMIQMPVRREREGKGLQREYPAVFVWKYILKIASFVLSRKKSLVQCFFWHTIVWSYNPCTTTAAKTLKQWMAIKKKFTLESVSWWFNSLRWQFPRTWNKIRKKPSKYN